jgi:structure-specific endonuclease subunit SLX4 (BTB/POZ domain-containing protein 12)
VAFSFSNHAGGLKRKGTTSKKEPQKRRKVNKPEAPSEDLLVAMALSRSEMEQSLAVPALRLESASSEMIRFGAGTCGWRNRESTLLCCWLTVNTGGFRVREQIHY